MGEVSALLPVTGSFVRHAEILVDPALAFAVGWNVVYGCFISVPSEISASVVLIQYWTDINAAVWVTILIVVSVVVAVSLISVYGEIEFIFAILKILLVIFVVILGLVIDLGGVPGVPRRGFHYWKDPGPFVEYIATGSLGRFLGFWAVMTNAVYSFAGVESLATTAGETKNPRQNIPKACKRVFARVSIFYVATVLVVGMLVSSADERLGSDSGTAATSPFVIAAGDAGIKAIPSVVNAVCLTSAWSASNQSILTGTRTLYGLAVKGHAPKIFLRTTKWGVPYMCVLLQVAFSFLAYMCVSNNAMNVFWWFVDLTAAGTLVSWITIAFNHIRLLQALDKQGISPTELPWHNRITSMYHKPDFNISSLEGVPILTLLRIHKLVRVGLLCRDSPYWWIRSFHRRKLGPCLICLIVSVSLLLCSNNFSLLTLTPGIFHSSSLHTGAIS